MDEYLTHTAEDLALDPRFVRWVRSETEEETLLWGDFLARNPGRKQVIETARVLVQSLQVKEAEIPDRQVRESFRKLEHRLDGRPRHVALRRSAFRWYAAAASVLLLAAAGTLFFRDTLFSDTYQTAYGETRRIVLPDQSTVVLNADSRLTLKKDWRNSPRREVWLEGEAFFEVRRKPAGIPFTVYTPDLDVEVLGTRFNVRDRSRSQVASVALVEGSVRVSRRNDGGTILMQPGDLVSLTRQTRRLARRQADPEAESVWKTHRFPLNRTPLKTVALFVRDTYGLEVVFEDDSLQNMILDGTSLPTDNRDVFLNAVARTLGIRATVQEGKLVFSR